MNNFAKLGNQLVNIWKQLGVSQKVSVLVATLVLVAGLIGVAVWSSRADYSLLYGKLADGEASKVIAALDDAKVPYRVGGGGGSIFVPADKVYLMRMQLAGRGIPRSSEGVGFEIFDKPNFGISDFVQRANYVRAVQGELERTISQMDEIESARVMVVLPENRLLLDRDKHPTASVFVRVRGNSQLQAQAVNSIRFLVANSVEGLKPNFVSIVDNLGNVLSENTENDSLTGLSSTQLAARRNLEQYLGKKAQDMLEKVLGPGQALVRVSAEINLDTITKTEEKFDPDGQVIRHQTKDDMNDDSTTTTSSSPSGVAANVNTDTNNASGASPITKSLNHKSTSTVEYEVGKTTSSTMQSAGGVKRLTAAVTVAARYEGEGKERKLAPRTAPELEKLQRIVTSAVGIDTTRGDTISLEEMAFNEQFATDVTHQLDQQQKTQFWWDLAKNLAYPALGVIAFVILLGLWKSTPVQEIPLGVPVGRLVNGRNGQGQPAWNQEPDSTVVTVEVLNRLIKENPGNMTQAIRDWMAKGSAAEN